jgi:hypothetical protein
MKTMPARKVWTTVAAILLAATALLKVLETTNSNSFFEDSDSVLFFLTHRQSILLAAGLEVGVAIYLLVARNAARKGLALLWLCGVFFYKVSRIMPPTRRAPGEMPKAFHFQRDPLRQLALLGTWL